MDTETSQSPLGASPEYAAFVGLDWGDQKHAVSLCVAGHSQIERITLEQTPEALADWANALRLRFPNGKVAVCLEQARGALLSALLKYEHIVAYPLNPKSLACFREALYPSRTKNDTIDADLLLEWVLKHRDRLRPWKPDTEQTRHLALLNEQRRHFVDHRTRLTNELLSHLKAIFPQAVDLVGENLAADLCTDFLTKWPTLQHVQKVQPAVLRRFYYGHNSRSEELITQRLALIKKAVPLTTDGALLKSHALAIKTLVHLLKTLRAALQEHDEQIEQLFATHPDAYIFKSLPGAGAVFAPRLLTALGTDRGCFDSAERVSCHSGIAPVTEQSGKLQFWVHTRWSCPTFLRQTWHEFANSSIKFSAWASAYYLHLRRKMKHHAAVRALAFKWQRIIWRMWQDRTPYDETRYIKSLQKRGIDIYTVLANEPITKTGE